MSLDDALALAEELLADYDASGLESVAGPDILWRDQLARALRELATAASARHVMPVSGRPVAIIRAARQTGDGGQEPGNRHPGRVRDGLGRKIRSWVARVPEPGPVVLSAAEADTTWQALADAEAWHGVYGDCAACVAEDTCADKKRHAVIAAEYAALRARLGDKAR
jgi:hypothetical protein